MAMLDSLFGKPFKASRCKTLLKLTIPRIKLLRNRRDIQIKQMRREIAKLLETGQEATALIRVEHIIREEKMMAAQEIVELFSELITARLPIIEAQRECPLDLKEAISSVCFAAPRCPDLPELQEAQIQFSAKYGKVFVSAATELMPECGVNRQLVELLSVQAPVPDVKLKLLKEIAKEHELDWNPSTSESELLKPHEDLLNGPTQTVSMTEVPVPKEHDETKSTTSKPPAHEFHLDSDEEDYEIIDFPEVPSQPLLQSNNKARPSAPEMLPFPMSALSDDEDQDNQNLSQSEPENVENQKQFLPFIYPPPSQDMPPSNDDVDLQDVLAAAQTAAEASERAVAAARSAASIAQLRINELVKNNNNNNNNNSNNVGDDDGSGSCDENPFHLEKPKSDSFVEKAEANPRDSFGDFDIPFPFSSHNNYMTHQPVAKFSYDESEGGLSFDSSPKSNNDVHSHVGFPFHQPQRLQSMDENAYFSKLSYDDADRNFDSSPESRNDVYSHVGFQQPQRLQSMDDETVFSYPDLFTSQRTDQNSQAHSFRDSK